MGLARAYCQLAFSLYLSSSSSNLSKEQKELKNQERYYAITEANKILTTLVSISKTDPKSDLLISKTLALLYDYKGLFELEKGFIYQAIKYFKQSLSLSSKINYDYVTSVTLNNLSVCYLRLGNYNLASETIDKKISLIKKTGNVKELALAYSIKGDIYRELGQLEKALGLKKLIIDLGESLQRPFLVSFGLGSIAGIYFEMGEFELARSNFNKSATILSETFGEERNFSLNYTKNALGVIARYEMEYESSINYFKSILDNLVNEVEKIPTLFELIVTLLEMNTPDKINEANVYLKIIFDLNQKYPDFKDHIDIYNLAHAMILNKSPRIERKFQAKGILLDLEQKALKPKHQLLASQALIDILLYELKASGDEEIVKDLKNQIEKIFSLSQTQKRFSVMVDSYLLESRVEIIEGNYQRAFEILEKAQSLCQEKNLQGITKRIEVERDTITKYITFFNEQMKNNLSIIKRIEVVQFEDYLNKAKMFLSDSMDDKEPVNLKFIK